MGGESLAAGPVPVRVFTHPTCTSCPAAIRMVQRLAGEVPKVAVRVVSLASEAGREEAQRCGILSVPTVVIGQARRLVGVPRWEELLQAVEAESLAHADSLVPAESLVPEDARLAGP